MLRWVGKFEGFILIVLGIYIFSLIVTGGYAYYLNPKFVWLTGLAGVFLLILGGFHFISSTNIIRTSRIAIFSILMTLCIFVPTTVVGTGSPLVSAEPADKSEILPADEEEQLTAAGAREVLDGKEYIRINHAELAQMTLDEEHEKLKQHYVIRGYVLRDENLDEEGQFASLRTQMVCCVADAVEVAFRVPYGKLDELENRQWLKIYGKLERTIPYEESLGGFITYVVKDWILIPHKIKRIGVPQGEIYIKDVKGEEPYGY
jgi:uncharacterized repeat protein (TIGR03943 family)